MFRRLLLATAMTLAIGLPLQAQSPQQPPRPFEQCSSQAPYGWPMSSRPNVIQICRSAYALSFDTNARVANWVVYTLQFNHTIGCDARVDVFAADQSIPRGQRSELRDYEASGYDTGHIANNADMNWDPQAARESFILSNMAPQLPNLNRGSWRQLESAVRVWAYSSGASLTIYAGSIYNEQDQRIGPNGVIVPNSFYKIVVNNLTRQSLAFVFPHTNGIANFRTTQTTVAEVERQTGITFGVPDDKTVQNTLWPINTAPMLAARRTRCAR